MERSFVNGTTLRVVDTGKPEWHNGVFFIA